VRIEHRRNHRAQNSQSGSVLVEFALIALFFYIVLALTIDFGRMIYTAQVLQEAARVAARELAVTSLPADFTFENALQDPQVISRVFNPDALVIDLDTCPNVEAFFATLPAVNKILRPIMIVEHVDLNGPRRFMRYPGALLSNSSTPAPCTPSGFTVGIPQIDTRDPNTGAETITWVPVLEEIRVDPANSLTGPFSFLSTATDHGLVALRLNYPYQAAASSSFRTSPAGPFEANLAYPNLADDGAVTDAGGPPPGTTPVGSATAIGPYAGPYGLGRQMALGQTNGVRPFRKLLAAQAIFRREVFQ
jgi:hypothetical protein